MRQLKISKQITGRDSFSIEKYLQEIGKIDVLTPDEEVALAKKIRSGDRAARELLVKSNLRFVVSVAKQYQNNGLSLGDLINEGNLGLIKAAECFDETKGFKFISYAVWWIRQSILQAIAENSRLVRLPLNKISSINKVNKFFFRLEQEFQREPTAEEIALKTDVPEKEVKDSLRVTNVSLQQMISVYSPKGGVGKSTIVRELAHVLSNMKRNGKRLKILVLDADWEFGDVDSAFGICPSPNVMDWVKRICNP